MCCFICEKRILAPKVVSSEALVRVLFVFDGKQKKERVVLFPCIFLFRRRAFPTKERFFHVENVVSHEEGGWYFPS